MTNRFLTHFSTVFLIHLVLIVSGLTLIDQEHALRHYGKHMLNLTVSSDFSEPFKSLRLPSRPKVRPVDGASPVTEAPSAEVKPGALPSTNTSALSGTALADFKAIYMSELRARIDQHKFYPAVARRLRQEGEPLVGFTLLPDGTIIDIKIKKSSANPRLDEAALDAVKAVKKFKPLPKELGDSRIDFEIPVRFHLL